MGNLLSARYTKNITTKNGEKKYLSECFYKYEDRNINVWTTVADDKNTEGGKFWEAFWDLWKTQPRFKISLKKHHFSVTKRRVTNMSDMQKYEKWSLQINHWLPVESEDLVIDEATGLKRADIKRQQCFDACLDDISDIVMRRYPKYLNPAVTKGPSDDDVCYGFPSI